MERLRQIAAHFNLSGLPTAPIVTISKACFSHVREQVTQVDLSNALNRTVQSVSENPKTALWNGVQVAAVLCPGMITVPILSQAGFTSLGPAAESAASWAQPKMGSVVGRGTFAYVQSAGMGGYGRPVVEGVARVVILMPRAAGRTWRYFRG
ncbi:hypothetical protein BDV23DRAFT_189009 [Aspergillus alliaceus]|uniref:Uncharacterized protein n=1 Tax=Petromyces alliaceus TaxID=209559 RepID=A0A5N7BT43_PETAA|nr:hypothetical protein BDV23DRAFT_189009 [Aspergillus alliaceus]